MSWSFSAAENKALDYLPHSAQVLYLRLLRPRMNYDDGVVGLTARLSENMLAEWLEVHPPPRSTVKKTRPTRGELRNMFVHLERAGLIARVCNEKNEVLPLVFKLPLARTGLIRQKYEQPKSNQEMGVCATKIESAVYGLAANCSTPINSGGYDGFGAVENYENNSEKNRMNNQPKNSGIAYEQPTSGMSCLSSLSLHNITTARGNGYVISPAWLPADQVVDRIILDFDLPIEFIQRKAIEFRILWREQNIIAMNWDSYFYGACKNKINERDGEFLTAREYFRAGRV